MCNRTCSVKRSVTRQGHDTRDKEGRSELAGKPIEGVQSSSCRAALSFFFKTSVWAAGAPFPSSLACSPVLQVSCPDLAYPAACLQCGIILCSQALSRCWLLIFLHLCCSRLALYGQLIWQKSCGQQMAVQGLHSSPPETFPSFIQLTLHPFFQAEATRCVLRTSLGNLCSLTSTVRQGLNL